MEKERTREVLDNLIAWVLEVFNDNPEAVNDMLYAMDLTDEEIDELDLREYVEDVEDDSDESDDDYDEEDDNEELEPGYKRVKWTDEEWDKRDKFADKLSELYGDKAYLNWCVEDDIVETNDTRLTWIVYKDKKDRDNLIKLAEENGFRFSGDEDEIGCCYFLYLD